MGLSGASARVSELDLGQLGRADHGVGVLQEAAPGTLVVVGAVVGLCVAVCCAEVVAAPEDGRQNGHVPRVLRYARALGQGARGPGVGFRLVVHHHAYYTAT